MNGSKNIFAGLCAALWLTAGTGRAETACWSDNFETNAASHWTTGSAWKIGAPTAGPAKTHSGSNCAGTGLTTSAPNNADVRLACTSYNGASTLTIPPAAQFPRLRFWQWFNFVNAEGYVEIKPSGSSVWQVISTTNLSVGSAPACYSSGVWSRPSIDLRAYAGTQVQIAFHFISGGGGWGTDYGWYIDDVEVVTNPPVFNNPEGFETNFDDWSVDAGTWEIGKPTSGPNAAHGGTNCAGTVLAGNYGWNMDTRLISPPFSVPASNTPTLRYAQWFKFVNALGVVEINNGTTSSMSITNTTITTNAVFSSFNTNTYQLFGALVAGYSTPFYWNQTIGGWTNTTKTLMNVQDVSDGEFYYEAGATPLSGGVDDDYVGDVTPFPQSAVATNFLDLQEMTWTSVTDGSDTPVGYFGTNYSYTYTTNTTVITTASNWQPLSTTNLSQANASISSGGWTNAALDLSGYAGQTVQVAFHFMSGGSGWGNAPGWYVDDISVAENPVLTVPGTQTIYAGDTLTVTNYVTLYPTTGTAKFALVSPTTFTHLTLNPTNGVLTWATDGMQPTSTNTMVIKVTDNSSPALSTTNSFEVIVLNQFLPVLTVPPTQTIYAGQTLVVTNSATNEFSPDTTFTFALLSGLTDAEANLDDSDLSTDGVLTWTTTTALPAGTYTNVITATDNNEPYYSVTNSFLIVVSKPPPPVLTVPATQTIYAGRLFDVTLSATNSAFPGCTFAYETNSAPAGVSIDSGTGELTWTPTAAQASKTYTISVLVTDDNSPALSATNSFKVIVSTLPRPALTVGIQTNYAGQTLAVTLLATNTDAPEAAFTYSLPSPTTNYWIDANSGVLTWTNTGIKNGILTWTNNSVAPGTKTISVKVTELTDPDYGATLAATNSFNLVFLPPHSPTLIVPTNQLIYIGQTLTVTNLATNSYSTNFVFSLTAASTNVALTTNGVLMWTNTAAKPGTNTISVKVKDNSVPPLAATNSFKVVVLPLPLSVLTVGTQTNYAGQTLAVTLLATNVYKPDSVFTYSLPSPTTNYWIDTSSGVLTWTNTGIKNGVLTWTSNSVAPGTNTISVTVSNHSVPALSATNSFKLIFLPPPAPTLTVPTNQSIYVGQTLTVTNFATNTYLPGSKFTYSLPSSSTNYWISTNSGVLTWTNTAARPGTNTISVKVTDNSVPPLSATNNFKVRVTPVPPDLTAAHLLAGGHSFQFSLLTLSNTTWRIDASSNLLNWQPVFTNQAGTDGTLQFTDLLATNFPQRFYRAVYP
jgi:hypothetical protein